MRNRFSQRSGFTLLEVVIAIGLLAAISGMIVGISRSSLALATRIVETQNEEMEHQAFFDLLGRRFASLPGNARMELLASDSGTHYLSDLTLQDVPLAFTWGGEDLVAKAVRLSTVKRRSGFLDIVLSYYEMELLEGSQSNPGEFSSDIEPFAEIVLLRDVAYFEWRALDGRAMEWVYDWEIPGRLPLQLELIMAIGTKGEEMRHVFWIPPVQNPEGMMRQYQTGESGQGIGGGQDEDGDEEGGSGNRGGSGEGNRGGNRGVGSGPSVEISPPRGGGGR